MRNLFCALAVACFCCVNPAKACDIAAHANVCASAAVVSSAFVVPTVAIASNVVTTNVVASEVAVSPFVVNPFVVHARVFNRVVAHNVFGVRAVVRNRAFFAARRGVVIGRRAFVGGRIFRGRAGFNIRHR